jgi:hypothetical protein
MNSLELKSAIFTSKQIIIIKKNNKIIINIDDIERIEYSKPTLLNYLLSSTWFGGTYPGRLQIHLNKKIGKTKLYLVKINYKEFVKLPEVFKIKLV